MEKHGPLNTIYPMKILYITKYKYIQWGKE